MRQKKSQKTRDDMAFIQRDPGALLYNLFEQAPDAILLLNAGGTVVKANRQAIVMFGYDRNELQGMPVERLMPERFRDRHPDYRTAFLSEPKLRQMECPGHLFAERKDGSELPVDIMLSPFEMEGETMVIATIHDVTTHYKSHQVLQQTNESLQADHWDLYGFQPEDWLIFEELSIDMLCIADFEGKFKKLNSAWTKKLGFTTEELCARPYNDFVHPDDRQRTSAETKKLANVQTDTIAFKNRYRCKDGTYRWLSWNSRAYPERREVIATARDVTEQHQAEEQFERVVESSPAGIVVVNLKGHIKLVNQMTEELFGYRREEIIGQPVEFLMPERFRAPHRHVRAGYFSDPQRRKMGIERDLSALRKDGSEFDIEVDLSPFEMMGRP